jgi:transcriptional regulator with XRE-family HTH domain
VDNNRYDNFLKEFGMHLRNIRKEKGLSMEAVAYKAEIEYRQLGRIERGEVNTTLISLLRIAEALEVELSSFFNLDYPEK